jgi:tetratricopeptide (TPR) repeat protein
MIALQEREPTAAADWLRRAADLEPDAARRGALRMQLGTLYLEDLRDPLRAAPTFAQAELDRGDGHGVLAAARAWERAGRPDQALEAYQRAMGSLAAGEDAAREEAGIGLNRVGAALSGVADADAP